MLGKETNREQENVHLEKILRGKLNEIQLYSFLQLENKCHIFVNANICDNSYS